MRYVIYGLVVMILLGGCRTQRDVVRPGQVLERGEASWYGPGFHGKQTANGETYNQQELTAAHRTLPFNTVVRVRNLDTGKSVDVRINDRGPYAQGRVIDLSRAAAQRIDMLNSGVAPVEIRIVKTAETVRRSQTAEERFTVQVGSFNTRDEARAMARDIRSANVHEARVEGRTVYRVYVGNFRSERRARNQMHRLRRQGITGFVKQVQN